MLFLYDYPNWLLGLIVVGSVTVISYALYFTFHGLLKPEVTDENKGLAMAVLAVIATINSLLLAFSAVSVWDSYNSADEAVVAEANTIGSLQRDLAVFDSADATKARGMLKHYTEMVIADEWPTMQQGSADVGTWNLFDETFLEISKLELDTTRRQTLMPEIFARMNELLQERRTRLYTATSEVPGTLWSVVLIGTVLTMLTAFILPATRFNMAMIGALALSVGLVFFFIVAMDHPFAGKESISSAPFQSAIDNMNRWDREIAGK